MKYIGLLFIIISSNLYAQTAEVIKFEAVNSLINQNSNKIQVINFWATWCVPCVKELPFFENLNKVDTNVTVTLISLDFVDKVDKVNSFLQRKEMKSTVLLLDEMDYNKWIEKVEKNWSGAIPATLILNPINGKRKFVEKELQEGDLETLIEEVQ